MLSWRAFLCAALAAAVLPLPSGAASHDDHPVPVPPPPVPGDACPERDGDAEVWITGAFLFGTRPDCVSIPSGATVTFVHFDLEAGFGTVHDPGDALASGACFRASVHGGGSLRWSESFAVRLRLDGGDLFASTDDGATWRTCNAVDPDSYTGPDAPARVPWKSWSRPGTTGDVWVRPG